MKEQMTAGQSLGLPTESSPDYEYEERAAIRELDGGFEKFEANQFALIDIREREPCTSRAPCRYTARSGARESPPDVDVREAAKEQQEKNPESVTDDQQSSPKKRKIEQLRQEAEQTRKLMVAETDPQRSKELLTEWKEIYSQIIELKKGV